MERKLGRTTFEIKSSDEGKFSGRAMVYGVIDSYNDIGAPGMFTRTIRENKGKIRILGGHDPINAFGWGVLRDTPSALYVDAQLEMKISGARDLFTQIKAGLIDGLSIGFSVPDGGARFNRSGVRELLDVDLSKSRPSRGKPCPARSSTR